MIDNSENTVKNEKDDISYTHNEEYISSQL